MGAPSCREAEPCRVRRCGGGLEHRALTLDIQQNQPFERSERQIFDHQLKRCLKRCCPLLLPKRVSDELIRSLKKRVREFFNIHDARIFPGRFITNRTAMAYSRKPQIVQHPHRAP
jgi:hypothetical protein